MTLVCINRDFLKLISANLTVSSVPLVPFIILLLSYTKIRGKYEYFHDSIKMSSVVLCDHWGDLGVDGWIILGWISRRWDMGLWTGLGWPRIGRGGGPL